MTRTHAPTPARAATIPADEAQPDHPFGPVDEERGERLARRAGRPRTAGPSGRPSRTPAPRAVEAGPRLGHAVALLAHLHVQHRKADLHVGAPQRPAGAVDLQRERVRTAARFGATTSLQPVAVVVRRPSSPARARRGRARRPPSRAPSRAAGNSRAARRRRRPLPRGRPRR